MPQLLDRRTVLLPLGLHLSDVLEALFLLSRAIGLGSLELPETDLYQVLLMINSELFSLEELVAVLGVC